MKQWSIEEEKYLKNEYGNLDTKIIAKNLNRSVSSVTYKAHRMKLSYWDKARKVNEGFLDIISQKVAWWLGVFASDGNVYIKGNGNPRIQFCLKDLECIEKLKEICCCKNDISSNQGRYFFSFRSKIIYEKLCLIFNQGVSEKTRTVLFPDIPDEFLNHFVRGVVDGDGSIYFDSRSGTPYLSIVSASKEFILGLKEQIVLHTGISTNINMTSGIYRICYCGIKAKSLVFWLYGDCLYYLERKMQRAKRVLIWNPKFILKKSLTPKMKTVFGL